MSRRPAGRRRAAVALAGALVAVVAAIAPAAAAATRTLAASPADLLEGRLDGVAVGTDGRLFAAPALRRLVPTPGGARAAQVWSLAAAADGTTFLGTGPDGEVVRISTGGSETVLARLPEPLVTALLALPDGTVVAGTSPGGVVYRIRPGGAVERWSETGGRYVWDLALGDEGRVFAATGEPGAVVRIAADGTVRTWYESPWSHLVALETDAGGLLVGSATDGVLVRLGPEGHALVLHDDDLPEIADVAVLPGGDVLAAVVAPPPARRPRPAVRLALPGDPRFGGAGQMDELAETEPTVVEGIIEGIDGVEGATREEPRGKILRISPDGVATELWRSTTEAPFSIAVDGDGRALFGTGEPAHLYGVEGDAVALLAALDEGQISRVATLGRSAVVAASNPAAAYRLDWNHGEAGVFLSRVADAGAPARWGTLRWWTDRRPSPVELYTRTGSTAEPDDSWSAWSPALTSPDGSAIVNPDGRFLQWRVRIPGGAPRGTAVADVRATVATRNRPPEIRAVTIAGGAGAVRDRLAASWSARDPDGDPLDGRIELRRADGDAWREIARVPSAAERSSPDGWRGASTVADLGDLDEGTWQVRVRVDDRPGNVPDEAGETTGPTRATIAVDRTPPEVRIAGRDGDVVTVVAEDRHSTLASATVLVDGSPSHRAGPQDGVCDGAAETFEVRLPPAADGRKLALRVEDAAGNVAELELGP